MSTSSTSCTSARPKLVCRCFLQASSQLSSCREKRKDINVGSSLGRLLDIFDQIFRTCAIGGNLKPPYMICPKHSMEHWNTGCRTLRKPLVKIRFYCRVRIEDGLPGFLQLREEKFNLPHKAGLGRASKRKQVKFKIYDKWY